MGIKSYQHRLVLGPASAALSTSGTSITIDGLSDKVAFRFTAQDTGVSKSLFYFNNVSGTGITGKVHIYTHDNSAAGVPGTTTGVVSAQASVTATGWVEFGTFAGGTLTVGTQYWAVFIPDSVDATNKAVAYQYAWSSAFHSYNAEIADDWRNSGHQYAYDLSAGSWSLSANPSTSFGIVFQNGVIRGTGSTPRYSTALLYGGKSYSCALTNRAVIPLTVSELTFLGSKIGSAALPNDLDYTVKLNGVVVRTGTISTVNWPGNTTGLRQVSVALTQSLPWSVGSQLEIVISMANGASDNCVGVGEFVYNSSAEKKQFMPFSDWLTLSVYDGADVTDTVCPFIAPVIDMSEWFLSPINRRNSMLMR